MSSRTLYINLLGEFSIKNDHSHFTHIGNKSLQITRLLSYLIANKDSEVSKDKLIDILWPDETSANPSGALRNLVYRARQILSAFFPAEDIQDGDVTGTSVSGEKPECILFAQNAYRWNPDIDCVIDIYEFELYTHLAEKEPNADAKYKLLQKAHQIYKGDFLSMLSSEEWVIFRNVYYKNMYTKIAINMCRYLSDQGDYTGVIRLCEASSLVDQMDEQIHIEKMHAYLEMNAPTQALNYYYSVSDLFTQKFGIDMSPSMRTIYQEIIRRLPNHQQDISGLEENLRGGAKQANGTFYCNFDIFKNIYQINLRSVRRSQSKRFLVLLTLTDSAKPEEITTPLIEEMDSLYSVLTKNLRSNDVFTKSSPTQFSLILTVANENGCLCAIQRIVDRYQKLKRNEQIELQIDRKLIH